MNLNYAITIERLRRVKNNEEISHTDVVLYLDWSLNQRVITEEESIYERGKSPTTRCSRGDV